MVVGPNGTGKSTILNALCLGLGGEPRLLGRADDARDYIKHGEDVAVLEISIAAAEEEQEDLVVKRVIRKDPESSTKSKTTFYVNGERTTQKDVKKIVAKSKIALDNLCTFLPQDKVGSFSSLTPQQLLIETEKTLKPYFYDTHRELIEMQKVAGEEQSELETHEDKLAKLRHGTFLPLLFLFCFLFLFVF